MAEKECTGRVECLVVVLACQFDERSLGVVKVSYCPPTILLKKMLLTKTSVVCTVVSLLMLVRVCTSCKRIELRIQISFRQYSCQEQKKSEKREILVTE